MKRRHPQAFSLVEVVMALAIVVVAGFALLGVFSVGIQGNHDTKNQQQAAELIEYMCNIRRACPTNNFSTGTNQFNFPLPPLTSATNNLATNTTAATPVYLTWDGSITNQTYAQFGLLYNINPPTNYVASVTPGAATVYLCLYWPPQGAPSVNSGHYEVTTSFALP